MIDCPDALIWATIAIEDDTFLKNIGIDVAATAVAALNYLGAAAGENTPGGSTITQQLVRNIFFDFRKAQPSAASPAKRKRSCWRSCLTQSKSKEEILEMYFNEIYYGNLAYGAQTAAQTFFGKDVDQLSLGEAAHARGLAPGAGQPRSRLTRTRPCRRRWMNAGDRCWAKWSRRVLSVRIR